MREFLGDLIKGDGGPTVWNHGHNLAIGGFASESAGEAARFIAPQAVGETEIGFVDGALLKLT